MVQRRAFRLAAETTIGALVFFMSAAPAALAGEEGNDVSVTVTDLGFLSTPGGSYDMYQYSALAYRPLGGRGQVGGDSMADSGYAHGFVWYDGEMHDVGTIGDTWSYIWDVNDHGQAIGWSANFTEPYRAFFWEDDEMTVIGTLGGDFSDAWDINNEGHVTGEAVTAEGDTHAYLWKAGDITDLGTLGGTYSFAFYLNDKDQVIGQSTTADGHLKWFFWEKGEMTALDFGGEWYWKSPALNERGQVAGYLQADDGTWHIALWDDGEMTDLGPAVDDEYGNHLSNLVLNDEGQAAWTSSEPGTYERQGWGNVVHAYYWDGEERDDLGEVPITSSMLAINAHGQVAFNGYIGDGYEVHGFLYDDGTSTDIGSLGGDWSYVTALNDAGAVVGHSVDGEGADLPFVWYGGVMTEVGLPDGSSGWPTYLNDRGDAVGSVFTYYEDLGWGYSHVVLWEIVVEED